MDDDKTFTYVHETVTPRLRFVERDGKRILQQVITFKRFAGDVLLKTYQQWRDVPLEDESMVP